MRETAKCPGCDRDFALTRSGQIRKHRCAPRVEVEGQALVEVEGQALVEVPEKDENVQVESLGIDGVAVRGCCVVACDRPEFEVGYGLCGGHWATRPDLRKEARRV